MDEAKEKTEELREEVGHLEKLLQKPDFWQNKGEAAKIQKRYSLLRDRLKLIVETKDKYDRGPAILSISSGAGGRDAEDWAALLLRMYQRFCERKNWTFKILAENFSEGGGPEGRIGIREVAMEIKGKLSYGLLKKETGVHRLVRISPFSAKKLRHTSFAKVEVLPSIKENETDIEIQDEDLRVETFRSSGKGGQNVNKRETAVRIIHLPSRITVACQVERTQGDNRRRAMEILLAKLYGLREQEKEKELRKIKGERVAVDFGSQIRSYVFHPYKLVKDLRTGVKTSDVESVLDGDLDRFIEAEI